MYGYKILLRSSGNKVTSTKDFYDRFEVYSAYLKLLRVWSVPRSDLKIVPFVK